MSGSKWCCSSVLQSRKCSQGQRTSIWLPTFSLLFHIIRMNLNSRYKHFLLWGTIGHGKFETLGALGISAMLLATGSGIAWHALDLLSV